MEVLDSALAVLFFEEVSAGVDVFGLVSEHGIDDTSEFVGGSGDGGRGIGTCSDAAEEGAEIRIAVGEGSGSQTESLSGSILRLFGAGFDDLATGDVIVGTDREPRGKVLDRFPLGHIEADFGEDGLDG